MDYVLEFWSEEDRVSVVLYKRRLAPQKYIHVHECRRVAKFRTFSTCCFVWNGYGYGRIQQYVYRYRYRRGTGTGVERIGVQAYVRTYGNFIVRSAVHGRMNALPFRIKLVWFTPQFRIVVQRLSWEQHIHSLLHGEVTHNTVLSAHTKISESVGKQYSY